MVMLVSNKNLTLSDIHTLIKDNCQSDIAESLMEQYSKLHKETLNDKQMYELLIQITAERTSIQETEYQFLAAKFLLDYVYKEANANRNLNGKNYERMYELISKLSEENIYGKYILENYSVNQIKELQQYIDAKRDLLYNYTGLKLLVDRYLKKDAQGNIMECPQDRNMLIAMHLAIPEASDDRVIYAKRFYDMLSKLKMTVATPTLSNAGTSLPQLSSCFIDTVGDDLISIYNVNTNFARVSKFGGGMGIYIGKVRAKNSDIRGVANASGGVISWVKNYNNTALAVDQLGVRQGSVAIYLDVWHKDILDFLNLKTNNGDDRLKAHDIFPGVCIPDIFMEAVINKKSWFLFCPHQVRKTMGFSLEDSFDDVENKEFSKRYQLCVEHPTLPKTEISAIDIMKRILTSTFETGTPFIFYRDTVNKGNANKHAGMIYSSNLCTEICQNMSVSTVVEETTDGDIITQRIVSGDYVVCNLSSINLGRIENKRDLEEVIINQVRMLDNVIDLNYYPVPNAKVTNKKYRAIGVGTSGYHQYLAQNKIQWESDKHLEVADELYEDIAFFSIKASNMIAMEKGTYSLFEGSEWQTGEYFAKRGYVTINSDGVIESVEGKERWYNLCINVMRFGVRNSYIMAIAPTGSTSLIAGSTASIDPVYRKFYIEEKKKQVSIQVAPNLNAETMWYYKEAHNIDQLWSIKAAGLRQKHIDQAQSFNLYITPKIGAKDFMNLFVEAWKNQLKTIYYVRNESLEIEECVSCSS